MTIKDVARAANVSVATVSRVINHLGNVDPETEKRVIETIERLNYFPNHSAKSLRTNSSNGIGIVISHDLDYFISFPYFVEFIHGMSAALSDLDYHLVISTEKKGKTDSYLEIAAKGLADGLILFDVMDGDERIFALKKFGIPFVVIGRPNNVGTYEYVDTDNEKGGFIATEHLFEVGCKRILFINGPKGHAATRYRLSGYIRAHKEKGIEYDERLVRYVEKNSDRENGYILTQEALKDLSFDGIFVSGDFMATGAMAAIEEAGLRVGKDIPIVGFDDVPLSAMVNPSLTTVRQPINEVGKHAAMILIDMLNGKHVESKVLDVFLVRRNSTIRE